MQILVHTSKVYSCSHPYPYPWSSLTYNQDKQLRFDPFNKASRICSMEFQIVEKSDKNKNEAKWDVSQTVYL